jgi:hypothetical protein
LDETYVVVVVVVVMVVVVGEGRVVGEAWNK